MNPEQLAARVLADVTRWTRINGQEIVGSPLLDEDDWPQAERYLNAAVKSCAALTDGGSNG